MSARPPLTAVCVSGAFWMFAAALLSDAAYFETYEIQWSNFASWLLVGALLLSAIALVGAIVRLVRGHRERANVVYTVVLALAFIVGLWSALVHARDAWATMPGGFVLSMIATLLAATATRLAFRRPVGGEAR